MRWRHSSVLTSLSSDSSSKLSSLLSIIMYLSVYFLKKTYAHTGTRYKYDRHRHKIQLIYKNVPHIAPWILDTMPCRIQWSINHLAPLTLSFASAFIFLLMYLKTVVHISRYSRSLFHVFMSRQFYFPTGTRWRVWVVVSSSVSIQYMIYFSHNHVFLNFRCHRVSQRWRGQNYAKRLAGHASDVDACVRCQVHCFFYKLESLKGQH